MSSSDFGRDALRQVDSFYSWYLMSVARVEGRRPSALECIPGPCAAELRRAFEERTQLQHVRNLTSATDMAALQRAHGTRSGC